MNHSNARAKTTKLALSTQKMRELTPQMTNLSPNDNLITNSEDCAKTNAKH